MPEPVLGATLYFDPCDASGWRASRWLLAQTTRRGIPVQWRASNLRFGVAAADLPEAKRGYPAATEPFLRVVEAAHRDGADELIGHLYTAYGWATHEDTRPHHPDLVRELVGAYAPGYVDALDDESLDELTAAAHREAQEFAGDGPASPVTVLHTEQGDRGFFGPILGPLPENANADRVWQLVVLAAATPEFSELRSQRTWRRAKRAPLTDHSESVLTALTGTTN